MGFFSETVIDLKSLTAHATHHLRCLKGSEYASNWRILNITLGAANQNVNVRGICFWNISMILANVKLRNVRLEKLWISSDYEHSRSTILRRSRPEVFCKKIVLKNFAKITGKHLCQALVCASVFWSSFGFFFLVFPSRRLSVTFDIQIDLKMKHL